MLVTTTSVIQGRDISVYHGFVSGEVLIGANIFRDMLAAVRDVVGGRSGSYEKVLKDAKDQALAEMSEQAQAMGANAVIGVQMDIEAIGQGGSMLMVAVCGTAVTVK